MVHIALLVVVFLFPISEIGIALRMRAPQTVRSDDQGSMRLLWIVIAAAVVLSVMLSGIRAVRLPLNAPTRDVVALVLLLGGLGLRWVAILTLGNLFTADVAVHEGQRVIGTGPYRYVRHPSYAGLLLAFVGLGVYFGSWLSVLVLTVPIAAAVMHRIRIEESVLTGALGPAYSAYCARTKRLIPGLL